ncbi:MAG: hypothetical protein IPI69_11555 [Bacteroidales bacterium]|nr:hypothetical protein [Bacteroidales bacterium]
MNVISNHQLIGFYLNPMRVFFLKIAVATRGKGALLIDVKNMKMKN